MDNRTGPLKIAVLSSSLLTERMFLFSSFLPTMLAEAEVHLWTTSTTNISEATAHPDLCVEAFPEIRPFKEFPYNYLRRLNEYTWDFTQRPPSRMSMMRHVRDKSVRTHIKALKAPARLLSALHLERPLENWLERFLLTYDRSPEARERLRALMPDVLVSSGTFRYEEPAIVAAAKTLGIPVMALITSWDNPSTKNRMVFQYDGYLVWSEQMQRDMHHFFPQSREVPMYLTGAPQFDVFFQERFTQTREEFCRAQGLDPALPIILYAMGSPNLFKEHFTVLDLAESVRRGELGEVQLLVRPHPVHDDGSEMQRLRNFGGRIVVQQTRQPDHYVANRSQDETQIVEWVNTFRHAAIVVNFSSTAAIDGAIFDKPIVNLNYDPDPEQSRAGLAAELNTSWTHFKPIAQSGALWLVNNPREMVEAVRGYLAHPERHRQERRGIAQFVCGPLDGKAGERMARAIIQFARNDSRFGNEDSQ